MINPEHTTLRIAGVDMGMHDRLRNMTIRQLGLGPRGKGAPVTLNKITDGVFDPETSSIIGGGITSYDSSGLRVKYTSYDYRDTNIVHGDFQLYLSPVLVDGTDCPEPLIGDTVEFQNDLYKVINLEPWNAAGVVCGWKLQMRKG